MSSKKKQVQPNPALDPVKGAFENCAWFQFMASKDEFSNEFEEAYKHRDAINALMASSSVPLWVVPKLRQPVLVRKPTRIDSEKFRDDNAEIFQNENLSNRGKSQSWRSKCALFARAHVVYPDHAGVEKICSENYLFDDHVIEVLSQLMGDEMRSDALKLVKP